MTDAPALRWHIAYTNPRQESRVALDLAAREYQPYLPLETRQVVVRGRLADAYYPLFRRYVFVGLAEHQRADAIEDSRAGGADPVYGLVRVLRRATGEPVTLPPKVVSDLQFAEAAGLFDLRPKVVRYEPGQRVRVVAGPLADRVARIVAAPPTGRIHVLMEMFGGTVAAQVDAGQIRPVTEDRA